MPSFSLEACPRNATLKPAGLFHRTASSSRSLTCHVKSMAFDLAVLCRYVVIDSYVSREVAARARSEVLSVFRQGEAPPLQS